MRGAVKVLQDFTDDRDQLTRFLRMPVVEGEKLVERARAADLAATLDTAD